MSLFSDAKAVIAGGVNSPVRAFAGVGGEPVFFKSASGAWVEAENGRHGAGTIGHRVLHVLAAFLDEAGIAMVFTGMRHFRH